MTIKLTFVSHMIIELTFVSHFRYRFELRKLIYTPYYIH